VPAMHNSGNTFEWIVHTRARLARRRTEKPATKAGQIWALWPDIDAALQGGQSMKSIRKWLEEDAGITLSITSLTSYISRIRRRLADRRSADAAAGQVIPSQNHPSQTQSRSPVATHVASAPTADGDPLAQAKRVLSQPKLDIRKLHNDGDPEGRNLI
jgi:hypothetical protein